MVEILGTKIPEIGRAQITPAEPKLLTGTAPQIVHIPSQFSGYAIDVIINNLDPVGTLTYRINSTNGAFGTISPSGALAASDAKVVLIQIVTGVNWEITFNVVPLPMGK